MTKSKAYRLARAMACAIDNLGLTKEKYAAFAESLGLTYEDISKIPHRIYNPSQYTLEVIPMGHGYLTIIIWKGLNSADFIRTNTKP